MSKEKVHLFRIIGRRGMYGFYHEQEKVKIHSDRMEREEIIAYLGPVLALPRRNNVSIENFMPQYAEKHFPNTGARDMDEDELVYITHQASIVHKTAELESELFHLDRILPLLE